MSNQEIGTNAWYRKSMIIWGVVVLIIASVFAFIIMNDTTENNNVAVIEKLSVKDLPTIGTINTTNASVIAQKATDLIPSASEGSQIVTTYGSSSCPPDITYAEYDESTNTLKYSIKQYSGQCTSDFSPHWFLISGVDMPEFINLQEV